MGDETLSHRLTNGKWALCEPNDLFKIPVKASEMAVDAIKSTPLDELFEKLASYQNDPLGFVQWAFPWGEPGTPLEGMDGPEDWQRAQLERIRDRLTEAGAEGDVIEEDIASGHGIGKSAEVSWMILWAIS